MLTYCCFEGWFFQLEIMSSSYQIIINLLSNVPTMGRIHSILYKPYRISTHSTILRARYFNFLQASLCRLNLITTVSSWKYGEWRFQSNLHLFLVVYTKP